MYVDEEGKKNRMKKSSSVSQPWGCGLCHVTYQKPNPKPKQKIIIKKRWFYEIYFHMVLRVSALTVLRMLHITWHGIYSGSHEHENFNSLQWSKCLLLFVICYRLDHILLETTGLADPAPLASILWLDDQLESAVRLDSIVTVSYFYHKRVSFMLFFGHRITSFAMYTSIPVCHHRIDWS